MKKKIEINKKNKQRWNIEFHLVQKNWQTYVIRDVEENNLRGLN